MRRRYVTADVFTDRAFGGNPVAVVLDAEGLTSERMQALASEFNYSESTFVLPPSDPSHTAELRIFTPRSEVPFAGHPNVGTAFVLAREAAARGRPLGERLAFEELAGLVAVELMLEDGEAVGARIMAPEPLSRRGVVERGRAAACLSLPVGDVLAARHEPQVVSVGLPFLVVELASRDALRRAKPDMRAFGELFPREGADAVYAYTRDVPADGPEAGFDLHARMFSPLDGIVEDPATGSATAAAAALLADLGGAETLTLKVGQGFDMGRPSQLLAEARRSGRALAASVAGRCVAMLEGSFEL